MQTYEVIIPLETGRNLHILMASTNAEWAMHDVAVMLREIGINDGQHYDACDVDVVEVDVNKIGVAHVVADVPEHLRHA